MEFSKKRLKQRKESKELSFFSLIKSCLAFLLVFVGICITITIIASIFFYQSLNPTKMIDLISIGSLFLSAFISAFLLSKRNGQKYILGGLLLGGMIFILLFIGALMNGTQIFSAEFALKLAIPAVCVIGSLLGIKREKKLKRKHR